MKGCEALTHVSSLTSILDKQGRRFKGRFVLHESIGNEAREKINTAIYGRSMTSMRQIHMKLKDLKDCFNEKTYSKKKIFNQRYKVVFHILLYSCD